MPAGTLEVVADFDGQLDLRSFEGPGIAIKKGGGPISARVRVTPPRVTGRWCCSGLDASGTTIDRIALEFEGGQAASGDVVVNAGLESASSPCRMVSSIWRACRVTWWLRYPPSGPMSATADMNVQTFHMGDEKYAVDGGPIRFSWTATPSPQTSTCDARTRHSWPAPSMATWPAVSGESRASSSLS